GRRWGSCRLQQALLRLATFAFGAVHLSIGRSDRARRAVRVWISVCVHNTEIMFCVLIQVFGGNSVTTCRGLARKCDIALENLVGVTADLYVRTVAVEGLDPVRHARTIIVRAVSVVSTARALVWSWSHDTCLIAVDTVGPLSGGSVPLAATRAVSGRCLPLF